MPEPNANSFEVISWIVGLLVTFAVVLVAAFRNIHNKIETKVTALDNKRSLGDLALHKRLENVKDQYVRRSDLQALVEPLRADLRHLDEKIDRLINREK